MFIFGNKKQTSQKYYSTLIFLLMLGHMQKVSHNILNLPLLLPATPGVLMYEATSITFLLFFLHQCDSMIISFCTRLKYFQIGRAHV